jgi:hypothetical protein
MGGDQRTWIDRLTDVLHERWDESAGEPRWLLTYAELGQLAEQFPGTVIQIEAGMFETDGEIHVRVKLVPPDAVADTASA